MSWPEGKNAEELALSLVKHEMAGGVDAGVIASLSHYHPQ